MSISAEQAASQIRDIIFPEPESNDQPEPESLATPPTETEEISAEAESAPETEVTEEEVETESEESTNWTFSELAEAIGQSQDDLLETLALDVDGEPITLAELRKARLRESDYTRKTQELAEKRKAFEAKQAQIETQYNERLQEAGALIQSDEQKLIQEYNAVNWNDLEENDREEYIIKRQKFEDRAREISNRKNAISQYGKQFQAEQKQKWMEGFRNHLKEQTAELQRKLPDYFDEKKGADVQAGVRKYMLSIGYQPEEIDGQANGDEIIKPGVSDHRVLIMAHKARLYDELQSKKPELEKKVKTLPKVLKPGARKSKDDAVTKAKKEQFARLRKTGKVRDAQAIIRAMMEE